MKSISQRDIARLLGVNASTVSRALKGLPGVSAELQQKISDLAKTQGYRPNPFAMSLRYGATRTIGIIVPDMAFSHYAHIVKAIEAEARKNGYLCIVTDSDDKYSEENLCVERLMDMHVEGIAICLSQESSFHQSAPAPPSYLQRLKEEHIPVVLFDRVADVDCPTVSYNDVKSARQATLHLIDSGAQRIAFLGGPNHIKQAADRKHGYLEALRERHMPIHKELVKCGHVSFNSGLSDTLHLLSLPTPPDAILADHGLLSLAAVQAIIGRGLRIPRDISVIGFMSDWVSGMSYPRITFVKQNPKEIGRKTFKLLLEQIKEEKLHKDNLTHQPSNPKHLLLNAWLNIRESTLPIRSTALPADPPIAK